MSILLTILLAVQMLSAVAMMGLIRDGLRLPMTEVSDGLRQRIERALPEILAL